MRKSTLRTFGIGTSLIHPIGFAIILKRVRFIVIKIRKQSINFKDI